MPEVIIKYENPETLKVLEDLSKTMDFEIELFDEEHVEQKSKKEYSVNGVTMIPGDPNVDITELREVFTELNLDTKKLREAWKRPR